MVSDSSQRCGGVREPNDPALASILTRRRHALATRLLEPISSWPKYRDQIGEGERDREAIDAFVRRELYSFVDYLALYLGTGDTAYKQLYVGEKLKLLYHQEDDAEARKRRAVEILARDESAILAELADEITAEQRSRLVRELADVARLVTAEAKTRLNVLLVGDCLFLDIQAFLQGPCLDDEIALDFQFATSKNGVALRHELNAFADRKFDLIFYSPFTYGFSLPLLSYFRVRESLASGRRIRASVDEAMADVEATLGVLANRFECPIFVHNTVNILRRERERGRLAGLKGLATSRSRRIVRDQINPRLVDALARRNSETFEHLFLMDEMQTLQRRSESELSRQFYDSELQHPAVLGLAVAEIYRDILAAHVRLAGRKLVVCDLDNTLWDGVIGEGSVRPYLDRQRILQKLKAKGIVLAVNSKNDPAKVHWTGSLLSETDFVASQINWDSKVTNMKRIRESLNLKYKDYVFVDDRGDQLAMVGSSFPEMAVMDATDERTWKLLETWAAILPEQADGDRTQLYHERRQREDFVSEVADRDPVDLFAALEIRVVLREAVRADLSRVTELINRTNQFNCNGSRTTFQEVGRWHEDPSDTIAVIEAADKFGPMGLVSIAVVRRDGSSMTIPVFVLSCRVFGYGIETALLNAVKRLASRADGPPIPVRGLYRETPHNAPCKATYPDNGFTWDGDAWVFDGGEAIADPAWLTIQDRLTANAGRPVRTA